MNHNQTTEPTETNQRLREHSAVRFSGPQHLFDLQQLTAQLQAEAHPGQQGHRQMTIFHQDVTTIVLFAFEAGGHWDTHQTIGLVTIQILEGTLMVTAQSQVHSLSAGQILVLSSGAPHSILAHEASRMLLTVHLEKATEAQEPACCDL